MKLLDFEENLINKKIFITGHTGFTGSWLSLWLSLFNIQTLGYALAPETSPSMYNLLELDRRMESVIGDIVDYENLYQIMNHFQPDAVIHLAAQPLVRRSYNEPLNTFKVNAQGTANVLECCRQISSVKSVLCITTDKVYKNNEWLWSYRENDPLGGKDPYSASKAAAEMIIQSYMESFNATSSMRVAIARGGNIIGGGDWSEDRLVPDFVRACTSNEELNIRYPEATRPWQHVLALVQGYLMITSGLLSDNANLYARAWNLGPIEQKHWSVRELLNLMQNFWIQPKINFIESKEVEAKSLSLDSSLAQNLLGWKNCWNTEEVIKETISWYREFYEEKQKAIELSINQILSWRSRIN